MFRFNETIIREPTVCASLKLQYWSQLKYFVIEIFGRVAAAYSLCFAKVTILESVKIFSYRTVRSCGHICGHTTEQFCSEAQTVGSLMMV